MIEKTDIGDLKGIGEKTKKLFEKINVHTVGDLIRYYPHGYDVYEEAVPISELEEDAGNDTSCKRSYRNVKSNLVPYALP